MFNGEKSWPMWRKVLAYAIYASVAAGAIELVDVKVHLPEAPVLSSPAAR